MIILAIFAGWIFICAIKALKHPQSDGDCLQAKLCVEGLKLSYEYFCKNNIPHKKVGKLIVAQNPAQLKRLDELFDRGQKNKVPDLQIIEKDCISKYEPKCKV